MLRRDHFVKYPCIQQAHINQFKKLILYITTIRRHRLDFSPTNRLNFIFFDYLLILLEMHRQETVCYGGLLEDQGH